MKRKSVLRFMLEMFRVVIFEFKKKLERLEKKVG